MSLSYCVGLVYSHAVLVVRGGGELSNNVEADALVKLSVKRSDRYNCMSINKLLYSSKECCMVWHVRKQHTAYGFAFLYFLACQRPWPNTISSRVKVTRCTWMHTAYICLSPLSTAGLLDVYCVHPFCLSLLHVCFIFIQLLIASCYVYAYIKVNKRLQTFLYNND